MDTSWPLAARVTFLFGSLGLFISIANQYLATNINPSLIRASVLASLLAIGLMLIAILWTGLTPKTSDRMNLAGKQGFTYATDLPLEVMNELGWGTQMILTATPAASLLIWWDESCILRRGQLSQSEFIPGPICQRARNKEFTISLVNLTLYPGRKEFDGLLEGLPSVIIQPLGSRGWLIIGGWSVRCFSRSDETWIKGWGRKITILLETVKSNVTS